MGKMIESDSFDGCDSVQSPSIMDLKKSLENRSTTECALEETVREREGKEWKRKTPRSSISFSPRDDVRKQSKASCQ